MTLGKLSGLALAMEQHAEHLFGRGARPAGILKFKGKLDPRRRRA